MEVTPVEDRMARVGPDARAIHEIDVTALFQGATKTN